jgi:hypothetical protein
LQTTNHPFTYAAVVASPHPTAGESLRDGPEGTSKIDKENQIELLKHVLDNNAQPIELQCSEPVITPKNDVSQHSSASIITPSDDISPPPKAAHRSTGGNAKPQHQQMTDAESATVTRGEDTTLMPEQRTDKQLDKIDQKNINDSAGPVQILCVGGGKEEILVDDTAANMSQIEGERTPEEIKTSPVKPKKVR